MGKGKEDQDEDEEMGGSADPSESEAISALKAAKEALKAENEALTERIATAESRLDALEARILAYDADHTALWQYDFPGFRGGMHQHSNSRDANSE